MGGYKRGMGSATVVLWLLGAASLGGCAATAEATSCRQGVPATGSGTVDLEELPPDALPDVATERLSSISVVDDGRTLRLGVEPGTSHRNLCSIAKQVHEAIGIPTVVAIDDVTPAE